MESLVNKMKITEKMIKDILKDYPDKYLTMKDTEVLYKLRYKMGPKLELSMFMFAAGILIGRNLEIKAQMVKLADTPDLKSDSR